MNDELSGNELNCEWTRRAFLKAMTGVAGVVLVGVAGCSSTDDTGNLAPLGSTANPIAAIANADGTFTVSGGGDLQPGTAVAFTTPPDKVPGIVFVTSQGELRALSSKCTHAGCIVAWQKKSVKEHLLCPCH